MSLTANKEQRPTGEVVGAGAAGGGIGAILASVADSLPESSEWKSPLTVLAPIIAVGLSGLWLFVKNMYIDPYVSRKRLETEAIELGALLDQAKETRDRVRADPHASAAHKAQVERDVEELEALLMRRYKDRSLRIVEATP